MLSHYKRNNIMLRIAASNAFARFKAQQAASFIQLARKELHFDIPAKELVLLEFDRFSSLCYTLEKMFISVHDRHIPDIVRSNVFDLVYREFTDIERIMDVHADTFTQDVRQFAKVVHEYSFGFLKVSIAHALQKKPEQALEECIDQISAYLQHLLLCMHEFNNNIVRKTQEPFISYTRTCGSDSYLCEINISLKRAEYFRAKTDATKFVFKNYSPSSDVFNELQAKFKEQGFTLVPEKIETTDLTKIYGL